VTFVEIGYFLLGTLLILGNCNSKCNNVCPDSGVHFFPNQLSLKDSITELQVSTSGVWIRLISHSISNNESIVQVEVI
jgi:hypothetical protein